MNNSKTINLHYHEIIDLIPHRYPFLLIDRVEEIIVKLEKIQFWQENRLSLDQ